MVRSYASFVIMATLIVGSRASAQGFAPYPMPYGGPGAYGYPASLPTSPGNNSRGMMPANFKSYDEVGPSGNGGQATSMMPANFKSYEDPAPPAPMNMPYCKPMGAGAPMMPAYLGNMPNRLMPNPGLPTSAPMLMPVNYGGGMPVDSNFQPTMPVAQEFPCEPIAPPDPSKMPSQKLKTNPYQIDSRPSALLTHFDHGPWPDAVYHGWVLNWLWRLNCDPMWPDLPTRCWFDVEYLNWKVKNAPINAPLVTGNNDPLAIGAIGEPGTTVLFGAGSNNDAKFGWFSGARFTAGTWLCKDCPVGFELSGFYLGTRTNTFNASSAGGTDPIVSIPFNSTQPFNFVNAAGETSLNAGGAANQVTATLDSRLWGAEGNFVFDHMPEEYTGPFKVWAMLGVRYLELTENLGLTDVFTDPLTPGTIAVTDSFGTRNQFFGGQFGARASLTLGRWSIDASAKLALGNNRQSMTIAGNSTVTNGAFGFPTGVTQGGVFAEPSNIGTFSRNMFTLVPEGQVKVYYELTQCIRPFVGYNFLYMNNVLRPGSQIDHNINPTQNTFFVPAAFGVTGQPAPLPAFHATDFWAQGINVGVELRF